MVRLTDMLRIPKHRDGQSADGRSILHLHQENDMCSCQREPYLTSVKHGPSAWTRLEINPDRWITFAITSYNIHYLSIYSHTQRMLPLFRCGAV